MNINSIINDQLWKAVPGFPCYDAHPTGLVRNAITGKILSNWGSNGHHERGAYRRVNIRDSNENPKKVMVHYIIASTFIDLPTIEDEFNWQVDHIDHDTSNNDVRNLRWLPAKLNQILRTNVRPEVARQRVIEYYRAHDIDYDYFNLLSEI